MVGEAHDNLGKPFNFVGTGVSGIGPPVNPIVGNGAGGILLGGSAHDNTIGGTPASPNQDGNTTNLISGNTGNGITLVTSATNNVIFNNTIGLVELSVPLRNTGSPFLQFVRTGGFSGTADRFGQTRR